MSESWMLRYDDLHPNAITALRAIVMLDAPEIRPDELAAAVARGTAEITAAIEVLRRSGWVRADPAGADTLVEDARRWLAESVVAAAKTGEVAELAGRYANFHISGLDTTSRDMEQVAEWAGEHRNGIVAAVRAAARGGLHGAAADLAAAAWRVADRVPDPEWWRELSQHGEDAAKHARDPGMVFALLNLSAVAFASADDKATAAKQWIRALRLSDRVGDYEGTVEVLTALAELYRRWGRLDKAMDTYLELVEEHQRADDPIATATALTELGVTMLDAGEPADAMTYLSRADDLLMKAEPAESQAESVSAIHARALEQLGQAQRLTGQPRLARRNVARALELVDGLDEVSADRIRALLTVPPDAPLAADRLAASSVPPGDAAQQIQQRGE